MINYLFKLCVEEKLRCADVQPQETVTAGTKTLIMFRKGELIAGELSDEPDELVQ